MHIEMQFSADAFLDQLLARLRDNPVVVPNIFNFLQHGPCVVDRLVIGVPWLTKLDAAPQLVQVEERAVTPVYAPGLGVVLPVEARIATVAAVRAGGDAGPPQHVSAATVNITFRLATRMVFPKLVPDPAYDTQEAPYAVFSLEYEGKDLVLPGPVEGEVNARLSALGQETRLPVGGLASLLKMAAPPQNVGLAASSDFSAVCLRIEVVDIPNGATSRWKDFFAGNFIVRLAGLDWAVFVDGRLLALAAETKLAPEVQDSEEFDLRAGPSAQWGFVHPGAKGYGGFGIVAEFEGYLTDACPHLGITIGVDVRIDIGFRFGDLDGVAAIDSRTRITWNLIDSDVLWCGFTAGLSLWSILGPFGDLIGAVAGTVLVPIIAAIVADEIDAPPQYADITSKLGDNCTKLETDPDESIEAVCLDPIKIPNGALLDGLAPSAVLTDPFGLTLVGEMPPLPPLGDVKVGVTTGSYSTHGNCSTVSVDVWTHPGHIGARSTDLSRIAMTAHVQHDPHLVWRLSGPWPSAPWSSALTVSWGHGDMEAYWKDPYPLQAIVLTSHGARWVVGDEIPDEPDTTLTVKQKQALINECKAKSDPFWEATGRFNPQWHVDPPPWFEHERGGDVVYDWRILLGGLVADEPVTVMIGESPVMQVTANAHGIAVVSMVLAGEDGGEAVGIQREERRKGVGDQRMAVEQGLLAHERSFSTAPDASDLRLLRVDGMPVAVVSGGDGAALYAVGQSRRGPLVRIADEPVLTTAVAGREVLLGGPAGLTRVTLSARSRPRVDRVLREPVRDLRMDGGELRIIMASENQRAEHWLSRPFRTSPQPNRAVPVRGRVTGRLLAGVWIGQHGPEARFLALNHQRGTLDVYALAGRALM